MRKKILKIPKHPPETSFPFFCFHYWKPDPDWNNINGYGFWFRIFGYGLNVTNRDLSFSERNGDKKFHKIPFGFRWKFLRRKD